MTQCVLLFSALLLGPDWTTAWTWTTAWNSWNTDFTDRTVPTAAEHGLRGRAVTVEWISQNLEKNQEYPVRGEILVSSKDLQLVLEVEQNHDLLAPGFTETFYTQDGEQVTVVNQRHTDHCFYHGSVRGHTHSWSALSICSGFRALISLNVTHTFYLEPDSDSVNHVLLNVSDMATRHIPCDHHQPISRQKDMMSQIIRSIPSRVKRDSGSTTKYVELYVVADHTLFKQQNKDYGKLKARIMEITNYVDKFYRPLNIRVPLIGVEVWTEGDQCLVSDQPNATLASFLQWRRTLTMKKKHDNAQLLTGVVFKGTTIGMAPLEGMCSTENSGGINLDHSERPIGAAATMAHEMGHNLGMSHDHEVCCSETTNQNGGCVMAAATGDPFPRVFSRCSKAELNAFLNKGGGMCLYNMPNMKDLVMGKKCGNGFVEEGEECDCGEPDECINDCCYANNCTLKEDAQCAHGVCCQGCKLKQAGTICRGPAGSCDLPEYCTGASAYCPANVYLLDGSTCSYGVTLAYCYNGMCLTHQQQCLQLWGYGASPAHDACFEDVNAAGNAFGNCGKDQHGNFTKCDKTDAKCGKIQCHSTAKKPKGTNAVSIDTTIRTNGVEVKCRGTYVYSTQDGQGDLPDPGLVMTGTKCGDSKVCKERRCVDASFTQLEMCMSQCHGHGVCNSNENCHCDGGWAPPLCDKPGLGGSVDSGPVQPHSQLGLVIGLLFAFLVLLPAVLLIFYCFRIKTSYYHRWLRDRTMKTSAHTNPTYHLKLVEAPPHRGLSEEPQPVNVVRPLRPMRPTSSPRGPPQDVSRVAPPRPSSRPPRKPLPLNPRAPALMVTELRSRPSSLPPQRPLPQRPLPLRLTTAGSPSGGPTPKAPTALLVMPPSTDPKPLTRVTEAPPLRVLRPVPKPWQ